MRRKENLKASLLFLMPAFIVFALVVIIPFFGSVYYSLTDWNGISKSPNFVGLGNYIRILSGRTGFTQSVLFTVKLSAAVVLISNMLGILLALLLTSGFVRHSNFFRSLFYVPNTIGGVILGFIWQFIFLLGFPMIGNAIGSAFLSQQWLGTEGGAFLALLIVNVWKSTGYIMIIMIAAFTGVDQSLIDSAKIDGAGFWSIFFQIKLPLCIPYISVCLFWSISSAFKMFELNYALTEGGPYGSTVSMALNIYNNAFVNNKYGIATAESIIFLLIVMVVTFLQLRITRKAEERRS